MGRFFKNIESLDALKKTYRQLAFEYHPDRGGNETIMKEINAEYVIIFEALKKTAERQATEEPDKKKNQQNYTERFDLDDGFRQMIDKIIGLEGIVIEIIGYWIWLTGETKQNKEALKEAGYRYSGQKVAWYWRPEGLQYRNGYTLKDLDSVRDKYGSQVVRDEVPRKTRYLKRA